MAVAVSGEKWVSNRGASTKELKCDQVVLDNMVIGARGLISF